MSPVRDALHRFCRMATLNLLKLLKIYSKNVLLDSQNEPIYGRLRIEIGLKKNSDRITLKSITKKIGSWYYNTT